MSKHLTLISTARLLQHLILSLLIVLFAALAAAPANATGIKDIPNIATNNATWIVDQADVISRTNEGQLNGELKQLSQQTGNEVRLVVIRRLDYDQTIDSFADSLFNTWFPNPEAQANQTLIVLDTLTNNATIRMGSNVKEILAGDLAKSVIDETIGVPLREGNKYNQAFLGVKDRLAAVLSGESDPGPPEVSDTLKTEGTFTTAEDTKAGSATLWVIGLLAAATIIPMATYFLYVGLSN